MHRRRTLRASLAVTASAALASALLIGAAVAACSDSETTKAVSGTPETGAGTDATSGQDSATPPEDGEAPDASDASDATVADPDAGHVNGPGEAGAECAFNRECNLALRCECNEADPSCYCKSGVRGTGRNGIDPCTTSNACKSALCVEGPTGTGSFCSDECKTSADCTGNLPLCSDVSFVGRICIRTPGT